MHSLRRRGHYNQTLKAQTESAVRKSGGRASEAQETTDAKPLRGKKFDKFKEYKEGQ